MEQTAIEDVARRYRNDGYAVAVLPGRDALPAWLADFRIDLLAARGSEHVVVEVKRTRFDLSRDPADLDLAKLVNAQPDWRFDLVIAEPSTELDEALFLASEPTPEQVLAMLAAAEELTDKGYLPSACVTAWAGLEAVMRKVRTGELANGRLAPRELLDSLYDDGLLTDEQYDQLRQSSKIRNQVAHGLIPRNIDAAAVRDVARIARNLLQNPQVAA